MKNDRNPFHKTFSGCLAFKLWKKLPLRLAELFLTLEYASHAIWEGQVKKQRFHFGQKILWKSTKHYVAQRYTSLANFGNILPIRWVIFSTSIFDTLITVVDSCRYWGTLRWYNGYPPSSAFQQAYLLKVIGTTTTIGLDPKESKNNCL